MLSLLSLTIFIIVTVLVEISQMTPIQGLPGVGDIWGPVVIHRGELITTQNSLKHEYY